MSRALSGFSDHERGGAKQPHHKHTGLSPDNDLATGTNVVQPLTKLHAQAGNLAVQYLIRTGALRAKGLISDPSDPEETEADRVSEQVMRANTVHAPSACACSGSEESCDECRQKQSPLARKAAGDESSTKTLPPAPSPIIGRVLSSPGAPLDNVTRAFFEPRFARNFGDVRIHTGSEAAESAKSIDALAYTDRSHIAFAAGQYSPHSQTGRALIAHELAHVSQRASIAGSVSRQTARQEGSRGVPHILRAPAPGPGNPPRQSSLTQGEIGEKILEQILDEKGWHIFPDAGKATNGPGADLVAYDPATDYVYLIDNKALQPKRATAINKTPALDVERLGVENLDQARHLLDKYTGFSNEARAAYEGGRIRIAVSNAFSDFNISFSAAVFERGLVAMDIVTGGIYSNLRAFQEARAALTATQTGLVGVRPLVRGQRGFATVGGMIFCMVAIAGTIYAISNIHSLEDAVQFAESSAVNFAEFGIAKAISGSGPVAFVVTMLATMPDDQGEGVHLRSARSQVIYSFLAQYFSAEEIAKNHDAMFKEAEELLFNTKPLDVPLPRRILDQRLKQKFDTCVKEKSLPAAAGAEASEQAHNDTLQKCYQETGYMFWTAPKPKMECTEFGCTPASDESEK